MYNIVISGSRERQIMKRRILRSAAALATALALVGAPLGLTDTPEDPTLQVLTTPIAHGCSDGSDVNGYFGPDHRPVTLATDYTGDYFYCDERDDLPGYGVPVNHPAY
jgi:hypothetical protein